MVRILQALEGESTGALVGSLEGQGGDTIVLGRDAEAPRRYHSFSLAFEHQAIAVGVWSSGLGSRPAIATYDNGVVVVGHDTWLTWVDLGRRSEVRALRLGGVFFEFIPIDIDVHEIVLVVHELGVIGLGDGASLLWSIDTDLLEAWTMKSNTELVLTEMDRPGRLTVDVGSGRSSRVRTAES